MSEATPTPIRIGRYELLECLGGGMSQVWRAADSTIGRIVAVKILTPEGCAIPETCERFLQEARMAGNIRHDNIVHIYDYGEADGRPFLVMEFLQGDDLRTLIRKGGTGGALQKLKIALQIARAIEYIHSRKIIHRDIKPDNVRIVDGGTVKLMDFGIAKAEGLARTQAGFVLGSPYYMAPEQIRGEVSPLVDVYAFGILLFELFSGVKPFKVDTYEQIFHCTLNEAIDFAPLRLAHAPEGVIALAQLCTAKDPAARPQSFGHIVAQLERVIAMLSPLRTPADANGVAGTQALFGGGASAGSSHPNPAQTTSANPPRRMAAAALGAKRQASTNRLAGAAVAVGIAAVVALLLFFRSFSSREQPVSTPPGMVAIPGGPFLAGENRARQALPPFFIDRTEVSNAEYLRFAKATGRTLPPYMESAPPDLPAADVSYLDAAAFARWAGKRLPSFLEWERAARGTDGRTFPWGNGVGPNTARIDAASKGPAPVSEHGDVSPDGVLNMGGNVAEWVDQPEVPSPQAVGQFGGLEPPATASEPWFAMRGSSYLMPVEAAQTWAFQSLPARFHSPAVGFRCAQSR